MKFVAEDSNGCWVWSGATTGRTGKYGHFRASSDRNAAKSYAHRWSYEYHVGPIPHGRQIDHLCRVTLCVNPQHLEAVTPRENVRRGWAARGFELPPCDHEVDAPRGRTSSGHCRLCHNAYQRAWARRKRG